MMEQLAHIVTEDSSEAEAPEPGSGQTMQLTLWVSDPEVLADLRSRPAGVERDRHALASLRIGVLALRSASGQLDMAGLQEAMRGAVVRLQALLMQRGTELTSQLAQTLAGYLDPASGALPLRLDALVRRDGDLERTLRAQVGEDSTLARTLADHIGASSPLFRLLSTDDKTGLPSRLQALVEEALRAQSAEVLGQFSLDSKDSALSRFLAEISTKHAEVGGDLQRQIEAAVGEFSLDRPESALSRLVGRVETAQGRIAQEFSLDNAGSALARLRRELVDTMASIARENSAFQSEVKAHLASLQARREEAARSTRHGVTFEDELGELLSQQANGRGDVFARTGTLVGKVTRCKVGDHTVTLGPESQAPGAVLVFEAKDDRSCDLPKALAELQLARQNRDGQVGIFVFSEATAPSGLGPVERFGNDVVVRWSAEDRETDLYVRCGYSLARALAVRAVAVSERRSESAVELEASVRILQKLVGGIDETRKWAETIQSNSSKIVERARKMQLDLEGEVERLDGLVAGLTGEAA